MKTLSIFFVTITLVLGLPATAQDQKLVKKTYNVMPTFGAFANWGESIDYESGTKKEPSSKKELLKMNLIRSGVAFKGAATAEFDSKALKLIVTNIRGQHRNLELLLDGLIESATEKVHVYNEFIEVDHAEFSNWIFDNTLDSNADELRNEVQKWIKAGRAEIIESIVVVVRSGQRGKIESGDEFIYPTEYDPAEIPKVVDLKGGAKAPVTGVNPTAFETRNLGVTLEVDPVIGAAHRIVDLNLAPEIVELEKITKWPAKSIDPKFQAEMPTFYKMKITTQVTGESGHYVFLGTTRPLKPSNPKRVNPIVLQFVRPDVSSTGAWSVDEGKEER